LLAFAAMSLIQLPSGAGNLTNPLPPGNCQSLTCNSLTETKLYQAANPTSFQIWAMAGECLRIDALDLGGNDLALWLVGPAGAYFRNRNHDSYELLVANPVEHTGAYTLILGEHSGGGVGSRIELAIGRYATTDDLNCPSGGVQPQTLLGSQDGSRNASAEPCSTILQCAEAYQP